LGATDVLLLLYVWRISGETSYHASDCVLGLTVLGCIDERIDAAVDVHQYNAEVVEPVNGKIF